MIYNGFRRTLPSGAEIMAYPDSVGIDRLPCRPKVPWTPAVCDALARLKVAAQVRVRPMRRQMLTGLGCQPMQTFIHFETRRAADREPLFDALAAADAGDHEPADALAFQWFDEWPERSPWRYDPGYETWHALHRADTPLTDKELWRELVAAHPDLRPRLKLMEVYRTVESLARKGNVATSWSSTGTHRQRRYAAVGEPLEYDPLLLRVRTQGGEATDV